MKKKRKKQNKKCLKLLIKLFKINDKLAKQIPQKYWNKHF
jgi:hypothetical protein